MRIKFCRTLAFGGLLLIARIGVAAPIHPLNSLTTAEYWSIYDVLQKNGHAGPDDLFASVLLREPPKIEVLASKPGDAVPAKRML